MSWHHVELCNVFCSAAMRNNICYQTIGKAISAGFKTLNFEMTKAKQDKMKCLF